MVVSFLQNVYLKIVWYSLDKPLTRREKKWNNELVFRYNSEWGSLLRQSGTSSLSLVTKQTSRIWQRVCYLFNTPPFACTCWHSLQSKNALPLPTDGTMSFSSSCRISTRRAMYSFCFIWFLCLWSCVRVQLWLLGDKRSSVLSLILKFSLCFCATERLL